MNLNQKNAPIMNSLNPSNNKENAQDGNKTPLFEQLKSQMTWFIQNQEEKQRNQECILQKYENDIKALQSMNAQQNDEIKMLKQNLADLGTLKEEFGDVKKHPSDFVNKLKRKFVNDASFMQDRMRKKGMTAEKNQNIKFGDTYIIHLNKQASSDDDDDDYEDYQDFADVLTKEFVNELKEAIIKIEEGQDPEIKAQNSSIRRQARKLNQLAKENQHKKNGGEIFD